MQETEYSVPLERLAGGMPFQGLRKPLAVPGGLTVQGSRRRAGEAAFVKGIWLGAERGVGRAEKRWNRGARLLAGAGEAGGIKFSAS